MREAALMAFSYGNHPRVYARLHHLALTPAHPVWRATVSRLGDLGDGFTLKHLRDLDRQRLKPDQVHFLNVQRNRIRARIQAVKPKYLHWGVPQRLERAAWVDLMCDPLESSLVSWTLQTLRQDSNTPSVRKRLETLRKSYVPRGDLGRTTFGSLQSRVRSYARRILAN